MIQQATWNWTVTKNLLVEIGETFKPDSWQFDLQDDVPTTRRAVIDVVTGIWSSASPFGIKQESLQHNGKAVVTHVTGSSNLRVGSQWFQGDGRTALKWYLGRFVEAQAAGFPQVVNPTRADQFGLGLGTTSGMRPWTDSNGNYAPDCVLTNFASNGECGPILNPSFATQQTSPIRYDPAVVHGWGVRGFNWELMAGVQHQLSTGLSVDFSYNRRSFGNFRVFEAAALTPASYDPFCVTTPPDARLPILAGVYPLPADFTTSATFQTVLYPQEFYGEFGGILAARSFSSEEVAPSLGRPLSGGPTTLQMIPASTIFGDRIYQIDWRLTRSFKVGRGRIQPQLDIYNITNDNSVLTLNNTYGPLWQQPLTILQGRVIKFGLQADF